MPNPICRLLEDTPSGTAVKELMMNGEDISGVEEFVKYDRVTGLAFFTNKANSVFVAVCERIDMIEFEYVTEEQAAEEEQVVEEDQEAEDQQAEDKTKKKK